MKPFKYKRVDNKTVFVYEPTEMREFLKEGHKFGVNGLILTERNGRSLTYRGFGNPEIPDKNFHKEMKDHVVVIDGPMQTDDERLMKSQKVYTTIPF